MIYTFNAKDYLLYPIIKEHFELSDDEVYNEIMIGYEILLERLSKKGIDYTFLKGALIPNQDKDKYETCLIIDTSLMDTMFHGYDVFKKIIPLLDKRCTCSILHGEYIDIINKGNRSQLWLKTIMNEALARCNKSSFQSSEQYYIVYFNRLTGNQRWNIVENLLQYPWFTGFADLTYQSDFKTYLSSILSHAYIKCGNKIIGSHPIDFSDEENENLIGYPFEESGYEVLSINEESFGSFLNYKIESMFPDEKDVSFSFNALFPKFKSINNLKLKIDDNKWAKYLTDTQSGKGEILASVGYLTEEKSRFEKEIYKRICSNYIFNLEKNEYGVLKFNTCVELETVNGNKRRTTVALKYIPEDGEMYIITIT